jgi:hypothetical protein
MPVGVVATIVEETLLLVPQSTYVVGLKDSN